MSKVKWNATIQDNATLVTMIGPPLSEGALNVLRTFIKQVHNKKYCVWRKEVDGIIAESGYSTRSVSQYLSRICRAGLGHWDHGMGESETWFCLTDAGCAVVKSLLAQEGGAA